ncbi:uncharacterized protein LOC131674674 [Phymastichus coffea]|uniref:uncharacterized protein LOC131674674 n=1 Tax=Phymastichus coffea TaxID=108790 RepID=UPI00273C8F71|nr:uncharacterized protein LOC131674674 [Phymastichus coffea]
MVANKNETHATHKFKHLLYRKEGKDYKSVSFRINNLGADATRPDGSDYKPIPRYTSCQTDSFDQVYVSLRNDLKRVSGVEAVQLIEKGAEALLAKLIPEVNKTDQIVTKLSEQLFEMRHAYCREKFEKMKTEFMRTEMQRCSMDVDIRSDIQRPLSPLITKSECVSPESPLMFDPPKISPSGSTIKTATKINLKQESSDERTQDHTSSKQNQMKYDCPKSPELSSQKSKSVKQRKAQFEYNVQSLTKLTSSFDKKSIRKSLDYDRQNS